MSMIFSIWTVVVMILFIGIVAWVWHGRNRDKYEDAAQIPFREEDENVRNNNSENLNDG